VAKQPGAPAAGAPAAGKPATRAAAAPEWVVVGRVLRPHGLKGEVVVETLSDVRSRFLVGATLFMARGEAARQPVRVSASRAHGDGRLLILAGHEDRDAATALRGADLEVPGSELMPADAGTYYPHELIGCRCRDRRHGDLGTVRDLVANGGGLLLAIEGGGREILVPFVEAFVVGVAAAERTLDLDLPEGLLETCTSRS
jgi:16S rRNA processing protein RimM